MEVKRGISRRSFLKTTAMAAASISAGKVIGTMVPQSAMAQSPSGTLNVITSTAEDSFDMHATVGGDSRSSGFHVVEALVDRDYEPQLATSWENPDKLTWIFHLRKGVEFSNGETFDASVVRFNLERIMDPKTKARWAGTLNKIESIDIMDKHALRIKTKTPYATFVYALREFAMMSPRAVKEAGKDVVRKPVGTGPFVLKEWVANERSLMEANPGYYGKKPNVKTITWRPVLEPSTRIIELKAGKADIINKIPPELANEISGTNMQAVRKRSVYRMGIKLHCAKPPFDNVKARQAFNYAANKEDLIKYVLGGAGYITVSYLGPHVPNQRANLEPYPYDPALARKLLAEAGHPNGVEIEIVTPAGRYLKDKELMEALSFQVKEAGFTMNVKALEWGMFLQNYDKSNGYYIGQGYNDPHTEFQTDADSRAKSRIWAHYHNDEVNRLLDEAAETFTAEKRNGIYHRIAKMLWDDAIFLYIHDAQDIYGVSNRVKGFSPRPDAWLMLRDAMIA